MARNSGSLCGRCALRFNSPALSFLICSMPSPAPTNPLSMKLRDLGEAWLSLRCTSRTTQIPMKMMAESYGTHRSLGEILPKLRCRQCGQAPERIELTDDPTRNASGKARNTGRLGDRSEPICRAARRGEGLQTGRR